MTIVVDSSVLVAWVTDSGATGRWAGSVVAQDTRACPQMVMAEVSNTLRRLEISRQISQDRANSCLGVLMRLDVELFPFAPYAERVWELRHNLTGYDAWYVAVAESLNCPLATLDRRLTRAVGPECQFLAPDGV